MSTLRLIVINVSYIVGGPVGGLLASIAFGWTALTGGLLFLSMVPLTFFLLRETPVAKPAGGAPEVFKGVWIKLKAVAKCRGLWIAGGFFFLIQVAPGLWTPLFWYQTNTLKFSEKFIGNLDGIFGAVGLIASFVYPFFCRRIRLRYLIAAAISCTILSNLTYLGYTSWKAAIFIHAASGLGLTLAQLPLFDLAARATPKGSESLGYSLMIACWNWGLALSNIIGSELYERFQLTFKDLVWVNAAALGLVLAIVPFLPSALVDTKEGQAEPEQT